MKSSEVLLQPKDQQEMHFTVLTAALSSLCILFYRMAYFILKKVMVKLPLYFSPTLSQLQNVTSCSPLYDFFFIHLVLLDFADTSKHLKVSQRIWGRQHATFFSERPLL